MKPTADRLSQVPLFEGLSDDDLEHLASWMEVEHIEAGSAMTREGRSAYEFFVLDEGRVRIEHDGATVATLGPGDVLGELAILGEGRRKADAVAEVDTRAFAMFGTRFREMQLTWPVVADRLERLATERAAELES
jgi:CRP-like cAMP-binding protein